MKTTTPEYDLVIVGAGVSGAAQYFAAANYSSLKKVLLVEKESAAGLINSAAVNNSQTLHEGDIETNYSLQKAQAVKHKAGFTRAYLEGFHQQEEGVLFAKGPKMVFGERQSEVDFLHQRYVEFALTYPQLSELSAETLAAQEPRMMAGRQSGKPVLALYNPDGITVDYGALARTLLEDAQATFAQQTDRDGEVQFSSRASDISKSDHGYELRVNGELIQTRFVSICAGAHSMWFAKQLGIATVASRSLLLVAGNFYYTPKYLTAKVYTVQNPKLPFSAVHGDPDILNLETKTRYGPTTRIIANLERGRFGTFFDYLKTVTPFLASLAAYVRIMFDRDFAWYAFKHNVLFLIPGVGTYLFMREVRKIIPTMRYQDITRAKGQGGVRPQIVDTTMSNPLNLGEAKIAGPQILFNVTPSPGATTCLFNGLTDIRTITKELGSEFDEAAVKRDFGRELDV